MNAYRFLLKATVAVAAIGMLDATPVFAAKKQKQKVTDPRLQTVLTMTKPVKEEQFVVKGVKLFTTSRAIQGFDVADNEATLWYSQPGKVAGKKQGSTKLQEVYVIRGRGRSGERMVLRYFCSGNNIAVEHATDGDYVWIGSNGTKLSSGSYSRTRTLSRVPFTPDGEINDGYAGETYYLGGEWYLYPAVNVEEDVLAITTSRAGVVTVYVYSLSEARALPDTDIKIKTLWKGEEIGEEEETVTRTIRAKDLTTLEPMSSFVIPKPDKDKGNPMKDINYFNFRGFDADKDYIYFVEGATNKGNYNANGPSNAFITVFDHAGNVVLPRRRISVIADKYMLNLLGLTTTGYADICGIKVHDGKIYIAFSTYNKSGDKAGHRANIVRYQL